MTTLSVKVHGHTARGITAKQFEDATFMAAVEWNRHMRGVVEFRKAGRHEIADVQVKMGRSITVKNRWAEHRLHGGRSTIELDARLRWRLRDQWWKFWANPVGPTLLHEFGHVLRLPHTKTPNFAMYPDYQSGKYAITEREGQLYRAKVIELQEAAG